NTLEGLTRKDGGNQYEFLDPKRLAQCELANKIRKKATQLLRRSIDPVIDLVQVERLLGIVGGKLGSADREAVMTASVRDIRQTFTVFGQSPPANFGSWARSYVRILNPGLFFGDRLPTSLERARLNRNLRSFGTAAGWYTDTLDLAAVVHYLGDDSTEFREAVRILRPKFDFRSPFKDTIREGAVAIHARQMVRWIGKTHPQDLELANRLSLLDPSKAGKLFYWESVQAFWELCERESQGSIADATYRFWRSWKEAGIRPERISNDQNYDEFVDRQLTQEKNPGRRLKRFNEVMSGVRRMVAEDGSIRGAKVSASMQDQVRFRIVVEPIVKSLEDPRFLETADLGELVRAWHHLVETNR
ncbi:MAG: hypothetical protein AAB425_00260, partial [Bdellovibrionota bacterium]